MRTSIALATYNGTAYLTEQLDSLRLQTLEIDEVIICDDRSTDGTYEMIQNYIAAFNLEDKWKLYLNEQNMGYADNFHSAIRRCTGDIVFCCDQDDVWCLNKVEIMCKCMEENPCVKVLYCGFRDFDTDSEQIAMHLFEGEYDSLEKIELNKKSIYLNTVGCGMAIRQSFIEEIEKYWYSGFAHDEYFWKLALCSEGLYFLKGVLFDRRCHGNNASKKKMRTYEQRVKYVKELGRSYNKMLLCLQEFGNVDSAEYKLVMHNIEGCKMRLSVLQKRKLHILPVLFLYYYDTVKTRKSFLVEAYYSLRR